ncbi:MAG: T9SS type A sorting domain-containing protein [Bacteroidales bacterium]|nr:T9SS type A sorting domain-containing protein [Bacteroidales bacterium]
MIRSGTKILFAILVLLFGLNSFAQHHLFFYIPECPNPTGITSIVQKDLSVYPIPANDCVFVSISEKLNNDNHFDLCIYSLNGLKVFTKTYKVDVKPKQDIKIDTKQFKAGVYYLQYKDNFITQTAKILITN